MNRPTKFRAWDKIANEVYEPFELKEFTGGLAEHIIFMQFTGLKDKNGKDIYEGDIVKFDMDSLGDENISPADEIREIKWERQMLGTYRWEGFILPASEKFGEVIGNVWETPELLP